ncbi:hypothetical protein HXX76_014162 [Chlamydomonas incerta]|uniref:DNA-directed RNA polymerase n=1 Tax=Chlamydomonas incerta TaxID=51695 RepID=A0A835SDK4_CHLIN|nr:hypothetical protein HXX76_014162 [Chlamydomonas incerta]|eukprot:KAG2425004.1 hypothetical protein HXX76_014162 [Chlamydomonas incerta]
MNCIYYGKCSVALYDRARSDLALPAAREHEDQPAYLHSSQAHHEFHVRFCTEHADLLVRLLEISCMRRILTGQRTDGTPAQHTVLITDVHLLTQRAHVCKLRSIVCEYSDRTIFVLTTTSPSLLPAGLTGMCMQLRVRDPAPPARDPEAPGARLDPDVLWVLQHFIATARGPEAPNAKLCAYRRLAYALMAQCVPFARFGDWLLTYNTQHGLWADADLCARLADAELWQRQMKKSILISSAMSAAAEAAAGEFDHQADTWSVIDSMLNSDDLRDLVAHQLGSYNYFVSNYLEEIIAGFNPIVVQQKFNEEHAKFTSVISVDITSPALARPTIYEKDGRVLPMTPHAARLRNFSYSGVLCADATFRIQDLNSATGQYAETVRTFRKVPIGKLPVMVGSDYCLSKAMWSRMVLEKQECRYDLGGYFVINGTEKVVVSQDRVQENKTFVFAHNKTTSYTHVAEIRSVSDRHFSPPKLTLLKYGQHGSDSGNCIRVTMHHIRCDVPLFVLFRALGVESDRAILSTILYDMDAHPDKVALLKGCVLDGRIAYTVQSARAHLCRHMNTGSIPREVSGDPNVRLAALENILAAEFLPHSGADLRHKALYLGFMARKLLGFVAGEAQADDRDSYVHKRVDAPGIMLANLFRQYYSKLTKDIKKMLLKELHTSGVFSTGNLVNLVNKHNITRIIKSTIIDSGLRYALSTGVWGLKSNKNTRVGVAQVLNRITYNSALSHLRRVNTPVEKNGKLVQPRRLHTTQWGIICTAECFDPQTPILTWDGIIKLAKDIRVGDHLIDDLGNAVRVKSTCKGFKRMYEVVPDKRNFMSYTVTDNHILTLKVKLANRVRNLNMGKVALSWFDKEELKYKYRSFDCEDELTKFRSALDIEDVPIIDITIEQYLSLPESVRKNLFLFKSNGINWEKKEVALDPYILGMWLGDGFSHGFGFATADMELRDKWIEWGKANNATIKKGRRYAYGIRSIFNTLPGNKTAPAPLKSLLAKYGLVKNKHIPRDYLVNDRATRLAVLAGLVDTDGNVRANGHEIRIVQGEDNYRILHDAEFLAMSLGFSCHVSDGTGSYNVNGEKRHRPYKELTITGFKLYEIPTVLPRKKLTMFANPGLMEKKSQGNLMSSFKLVEKSVQPFVGWQLEGNGRFLLKDMSIIHNTPEGQAVGVVKNLALSAVITRHASSEVVRAMLSADPDLRLFDPARPADFARHTQVFVNGDLVGVHLRPDALYAALKRAKTTACIDIHTSVHWDYDRGVISVCTEAGRCVRPLYIVGPGNQLLITKSDVARLEAGGLTWQSMLRGPRPLVEYLDGQEMNNALVATCGRELRAPRNGVQYTHCELHASLIMGIVASMIPFPDHNQSPRNAYQSSMSKQSIGVYSSNYNNRYDSLAHVLNYPQRPLVATRTSRYLCADSLPNGTNAVVAIATYTGFNQEDAVIANKTSIERGMFNSTFFRTYREQNAKNHATGEEEMFCSPVLQGAKKLKPHNYGKLAGDGFVPENTYVAEGDIIVGRCMPQKVNGAIQFKDMSVCMKHGESGYVDRNVHGNNYFVTTNGDGYEFCKVRTRAYRMPTIGDKCASRSAQKGTIGMMLAAEDMPFTADGLQPDLIMNPHAIPTRMTVGQLLESLMGKAGTCMGSYGDATPFQGVTAEGLCQRLREHGFEGMGNEILYNGRTGEQMEVSIFVGITYYQRLKHMVGDKCHCLTPDHEVLTERGWRLFADLEEGDRVATLQEGGRLEYAAPSERLWFPKYSGDMYSVESDAVDLNVTANHRMYVQRRGTGTFQLEEARAIAGSRVHYKSDADLWDASSHGVSSFMLGDTDLCSDGWLRMLGVFYASGSVSHAGAGRSMARVHVPQTFTLIEFLCNSVFREIDMDPSSLEESLLNRQLTTVLLCEDEVVDHLRTLTDASAEGFWRRPVRLPDWFFGLSRDKARVFLAALFAFGGHSETVLYSYASPRDPDVLVMEGCSPRLAGDLQRLALHAGYAATVSPCGASPRHIILSVDRSPQSRTARPPPPAHSERIYAYTGPVFCLKVPGEVFMVRRNGKAVWTGNSRGANGPLASLTRQPAEGRARDGGLRLGEMEQNALTSHGMVGFLKERFMECSDAFRVFVCKSCNRIAPVNPERGIFACRSCSNCTQFAQVRIPYACKLFMQEIQCLGIDTKFLTS